MTSLIPSFLQKGIRAYAAITAVALVGLSASDAYAKMPNIRRQAQVQIGFDLTATAAAPVGASGIATIQLAESRYAEVATLKVDVDGLASGTYSVDAVVTGSTTPVHIADLTVAATPEAPATTTTTTPTTETEDEVEDTTEAELEVPLPASIDARSITTITISGQTTDNTTTPPTTVSTILLTGDAEASTSFLRFFANVRVTAPPASALTTTPSPTDPIVTQGPGNGKGKGKGKGKDKYKGPKASKVQKVHGHALAKAVVTGGVTQRRFFHFIAFGAPRSTTLNIVVNGETVGTVTSTRQGHVKFRGLPPSVDFGALDLLTITTADGVAVMQADF